MTDALQALCTVRDYQPDDTAFVMATMLRGLYYGDSWFSAIPKDIFMNNYKHIVTSLLEAPTTTVQVACLKEDPSVILGYSVLSSDFTAVHWVYVKDAWRNNGLARALTPKHPVCVTHLTTLGKKLLPKLSDCKFNPFYRGDSTYAR